MNQLPSTLPASVARANFYQILDQVTKSLGQFTITHRGGNRAVIMSQEEYDGWLETFEIMSDKKLMAKIKTAEKSRKIYSHEQVKKILGL